MLTQTKKAVLSLSNINLWGSFCVCNPLLTETSFCSTWLYKAFQMGTHLKVGLLNYKLYMWSPLINIAEQFPKWLYQLIFSAALFENSSYSTFSSIFSIIFFFLVILVGVAFCLILSSLLGFIFQCWYWTHDLIHAR